MLQAEWRAVTGMFNPPISLRYINVLVPYASGHPACLTQSLRGLGVGSTQALVLIETLQLTS